MTNAPVLPVILSGGSGTRLWPMSRAAKPKQFHAIGGADSLFRQTLARCAPFGSEVLVVCGDSHVGLARAQAPDAALRFLVEPAARNTAPAVAAAAVAAPDDALLLILPADHHVGDKAAFAAAVRAGAALAGEGRLVTFGVAPTRPETGFGYIRRGAPLGPGYAVDAFVEKPDRPMAASYLADGRYSWNAGIFLFRAGAFVDELARLDPALLAAARAAVAQGGDDGGGVRRLAPGPWADAPAVSVDVAVMERTDKAAVVPVDMAWSDVGSWQAIWEIAAKDALGTATSGDVVAIDAHGCLIDTDGPAVAVLGVSDLVVVASGGAVFVCPRERAQEVRAVVERLKAVRPDRL